MKLQSAKRLNRRITFSPCLEVLEDRRCPAVTMRVLEGHILEVMGDQGNNRIEIHRIPEQLRVMADDAPPRMFTGIDTIRVNTWAGDDSVRFFFEPDMPPSQMGFSFSADLGAGNDSFFLFVPAESSLPAVQMPVLRVTVMGGAGNDSSRTFIGSSERGLGRELGCAVFLDYHGGAGNDFFDTQFANTGLGQCYVTEYGDAGQDHFQTSLTNVILPAVQRGPSFSALLDGGDGNDQISMITDFHRMASSELPAVQFNLDIEGGSGNDAIHYMKRGATVHTEIAILNGGLGNDTIIEAAAAGIISAVGSVDRTEMDGGAGDDLLMFFDLPTDAGTVLGYSYELTMHGGAGNDTLIADVSYFGPGQPGDTASILEYGDGGDDQHILLANSGPFATLLIDGGLGTDGGLSPSSHSPNVTVINCEF